MGSFLHVFGNNFLCPSYLAGSYQTKDRRSSKISFILYEVSAAATTAKHQQVRQAESGTTSNSMGLLGARVECKAALSGSLLQFYSLRSLLLDWGLAPGK